jgi:hypothetical protein
MKRLNPWLLTLQIAAIALGVGALFAYRSVWFGPPSDPDPAEARQVAEESAAPIPAPASLPDLSAHADAAPPAAATGMPTLSASARPSQTRDPKMVRFEVVEGNLAVAYGDIILGQVDESSGIRNGQYEPPALRLWDSPEIPYAIDASLPNPTRVEEAIRYFTEHTPIRFFQRTNEPDAIVFQAGEEHCYSALGRVGGLQPVRLSAGCRPQEIIHELMHALGFVHEQSRPDRDQFIQVLWANIDSKYQTQFEVVPDAFMEASRGTAFDFKSVMLYRPGSFALRPELLTLEPQQGRPAIEPTQQGLSEGDIQRLKRLYRIQ